MASERIPDKIAQLNGKKFVSLEFFPPKTENGFSNLIARITRLSVLNPLFVSVTWGAGGSTSAKSLQLAAYCQQKLQLTTCLHLTCTNTNKQVIDDALQQAKSCGIRNILALRGDAPIEEVFGDAKSQNHEFQHAADLVTYIKQKYGDYFAVGVAAYPDGHVEGSDASKQDFVTRDLDHLVAKVNAGADFVITQLFFDVQKYTEFEKAFVTALKRTVPIIPGFIPINNYQLLQRVSKLSNASIPESILEKFPKSVRNDDDKVKKIGLDIMDELVTAVDTKGSYASGFHFFTLNLESSVAKLVQMCQVLHQIVDLGKGSKVEKQEILDISSGVGYLGKEATWDEFPNGRFSDSRSPAFGEIDGYGPSVKVPSGVTNPIEEIWGYPQSLADIAAIFSDYLTKKTKNLPFSDLEISSETLIIQEELLNINNKHWFSLSSQPSLNGCKSTDTVFGWGSRNGYLYQKAYVELLISKDDWNSTLKPRIESFNRKVCEAAESEDEKPEDQLSYYVTSAQKFCETNVAQSSSKHAVTWGVFPNKEIVQTTIIDKDSFIAWGNEVFQVLKDWANLYLVSWKNNKCAKSEGSYRLLEAVRQDFYLVTVFDNNFAATGLWDILLK